MFSGFFLAPEKALFRTPEFFQHYFFWCHFFFLILGRRKKKLVDISFFPCFPCFLKFLQRKKRYDGGFIFSMLSMFFEVFTEEKRHNGTLILNIKFFLTKKKSSGVEPNCPLKIGVILNFSLFSPFPCPKKYSLQNHLD